MLDFVRHAEQTIQTLDLQLLTAISPWACTEVIDLTSVHLSETIGGNDVPKPTTHAGNRNPSSYRADALILMSTPAGRLNLFNASIVLAVA